MTTGKKRTTLPRHGTVARYRLELKTGKACDKCKAANSKARADYRQRAKKPPARPHLTIVPDTQTEDTPHTADTAEPPAKGDDDKDPEPGPLEKALREDLATISEFERVPFFNSLSAIATERAKEADKSESATARSAATRQLFEVLKSLRSKKEGENSGSALDIVLEDFGLPLVP